MSHPLKKIKKNHNRILQLYINELDNLDETHKFLETYNLPRLNQEEIDNLTRLIINNEIDLVIKNHPVNKSAAPDCFTGNSTKHIKKS